MPVKDGTGFIRDGFGHVVAFHQHGIQGGDGTLVGVARALHELGQFGKHRRRKSPPGGRLTRRQTDFTLGSAETGDRVHHQQHALALIAEIFGNGRGRIGRLEPLHGRTVGGGHHQHGLLAAFRADIMLDEFPHFAPAFANQGQHADIRRTALEDAGKQGGLGRPPPPRKCPCAALHRR